MPAGRASVRQGQCDGLVAVGMGHHALHGDGLSVFVLQDAENLADLVAALQGVAQRELGVDLVAVAASLPRTLEISGFNQIGHDPLGRALADPDPLRNVAVADPRIPRDTKQHVGVVGQKRPVSHVEQHTTRASKILFLYRHVLKDAVQYVYYSSYENLCSPEIAMTGIAKLERHADGEAGAELAVPGGRHETCERHRARGRCCIVCGDDIAVRIGAFGGRVLPPQGRRQVHR